ncbi:MAG: hypothetical protein ACLR7U_02120 [Ruthenibacterium lactatiformans]
MKNFEQVCRLVRQGLDDGAYPACSWVPAGAPVFGRPSALPETTLYDIASPSRSWAPR